MKKFFMIVQRHVREISFRIVLIGPDALKAAGIGTPRLATPLTPGHAPHESWKMALIWTFMIRSCACPSKGRIPSALAPPPGPYMAPPTATLP